MKVTVTPEPVPQPPIKVRIDLDRTETANIARYLITARQWGKVGNEKEDEAAETLYQLLRDQGAY